MSLPPPQSAGRDQEDPLDKAPPPPTASQQSLWQEIVDLLKSPAGLRPPPASRPAPPRRPR